MDPMILESSPAPYLCRLIVDSDALGPPPDILASVPGPAV